MFRPVVAPLGQLEDAAAADVGVAVRLRDFLAVARDVVEYQPFAQGQIAQRDLGRPEPPQNLVGEDRAGNGQIRAPRLHARHAQTLFQIERDEILAHAADLLRGESAVAERRARREAVGRRRHRAEAEDCARRADDALEPRARNLVQIFTDFSVDVPHQLALVARLEGVGFHEAFGEPDDAELEAAPQLDRCPRAARDLNAAAADVNHHRDVARHADAINRRQMDEPGLFGARDHAWADAGLLRDRLQEFAAVFGLPGGTGRHRDNLINLMGFGQTPELRQNLECRVHSFRRERAAVEPAGTQPDHFLFAVDDLERQVGADLDHDHVYRVRADVDGSDAHGSVLTIMKTAAGRPYIMPVSTTRSELLDKRLRRFTRVLRGVEKGDVSSLHQARVASRRLRELLPILQLEGAAARKLTRRLRKLTVRLGAVRELDVLVLLIDELHVSRRRSSAALGHVGVAVSKSRDEAREKLFAHVPIAEMSRLARKLDRISADLKRAESSSSKSAARSWRWALEARVARRASRLAAAMAEAGALYLPERLHAVRIAVKKLRYAVELATEAASEAKGVDLRVLKRGQDLLGRMHDLQVLVDRVRRAQASLAPPSVTMWRDLDALVLSLEDDCRRLHARYMRMRDALDAVATRRGEQPQPTRRAQTRRAG